MMITEIAQFVSSKQTAKHSSIDTIDQSFRSTCSLSEDAKPIVDCSEYCFRILRPQIGREKRGWKESEFVPFPHARIVGFRRGLQYSIALPEYLRQEERIVRGAVQPGRAAGIYAPRQTSGEEKRPREGKTSRSPSVSPGEWLDTVDWEVRIESPLARPSRTVTIKFEKGSYRPPRIVANPEE